MTVTSKVAVLASETASTKRAEVLAGKRGLPVDYLAGLACTQLIPTSSEIMLRLGLDTPHATWDVYVIDAHDIRQGDTFVTAGREFTVKGVQKWTFPKQQGEYMQITLEEVL